jgi:hypothetical protein
MTTTTQVVQKGRVELEVININKAMTFQPPALLIERFMKTEGVSEAEAREQFEEIKKFLVVCASDRSRSFAPSKRLDEMWHTFILFTPCYWRFCEMLGGYIHHRPTRELMYKSYANTIEAMEQIFGEVNQKWWKVKSAADCSSSCSHDDYCDDSPDCQD